VGSIPIICSKRQHLRMLLFSEIARHKQPLSYVNITATG